MSDMAVPRLFEDEDAADGCICDIEFNERDAVSDADLPPSAGAVQAAVVERGNEDSIDGCDVRFNAHEVTTDGELPVATGGCLR